MLGKLLKHEYKATYKMFLSVYIFVAIVGVISLMFNELNEKSPMNTVFSVCSITMKGVLIIAIVVMLIGTVLMYILRYRSNILKDEGYLMNTLPVKARDLVLSKLISVIVWLLVTAFVSYCAYSISKLDFFWAESMLKSFFEGMGAKILIPFIAYLFVDIILIMSQLFTSLSVGYTFSDNKDVMSLAAYAGTYVIVQLSNIIGLIITSFINFGGLKIIIESESNEIPTDFANSMFIIMGIIAVLLVILFNTVSIKMLSNKLNLE